MHSALGTIPGWLTLLSVVGVAWIMLRGGTGTAVSGLQDTNRELVRQVHELKGENSELRERIGTLEAKTDVTQAMIPVMQAVASHESEAAKRSLATLTVLNLIAEHLGPEKNGE